MDIRGITARNAGKTIAEGKTKKVLTVEERPELVIIESKNDITAGDGAKHNVIIGKATLATRTTANVFRLLEAFVPVAFLKELDGTRFLAQRCDMIPLEVVVRREAHGSFLKRHPECEKGHFFPRLILEFFLKTSGKRWKDYVLPKDDPLIRFDDGDEKAFLFLPDQPIRMQSPFLILKDSPLFGFSNDLETIGKIALKAFLVLEKAWQLEGRRLVDLKVEFGRDQKGALRLADVIDNDSWRVLEKGKHLDKQLYRDGEDIDVVTAGYRLIRDLTERFAIPRQRLIFWCGSSKDDIQPFLEAFATYGAQCETKIVTCSLHKEPVRACEELARLVQEVPDSVVIAYIGRSNGAGPTLSAQTTVPVITVPATFKEFPNDVWSSFRTPSETPVMTVLDPKNAVLAALQILAMRNPALYAGLRIKQEERLLNVVRI